MRALLFFANDDEVVLTLGNEDAATLNESLVSLFFENAFGLLLFRVPRKMSGTGFFVIVVDDDAGTRGVLSGQKQMVTSQKTVSVRILVFLRYVSRMQLTHDHILVY